MWFAFRPFVLVDNSAKRPLNFCAYRWGTYLLRLIRESICFLEENRHVEPSQALSRQVPTSRLNRRGYVANASDRVDVHAAEVECCLSGFLEGESAIRVQNPEALEGVSKGPDG